MRQVSCLLTVLLVSTACNGSQPEPRNPLAPSAMSGPSPAPPGASANATPILVGQTVTGVLNLSDPPCGTAVGSDPPEPCQQFSIAISTSGLLKVQATTPGPNGLTLRVGSRLQWGATVSGSAVVQAGSTYDVSVALHGATTSQTFELTTSLDPR